MGFVGGKTNTRSPNQSRLRITCKVLGATIGLQNITILKSLQNITILKCLILLTLQKKNKNCPRLNKDSSCSQDGFNNFYCYGCKSKECKCNQKQKCKCQ